MSAGNEEACGKGLASELSSGIKREDVFVVTKLDNKSHAPEVVEPAVRDSLKRLQLDYVDVLLIHWPMNPEIVKVPPQFHLSCRSQDHACSRALPGRLFQVIVIHQQCIAS